MPAAKTGQAIKDAVLQVITKNIGSKTADMYRDFYDAHPPEAAIASAEELLVEFVGKERASLEIETLRQQFKLVKAK
jgi:hypothetical protein